MHEGRERFLETLKGGSEFHKQQHYYLGKKKKKKNTSYQLLLLLLPTQTKHVTFKLQFALPSFVISVLQFLLVAYLTL